MLSKENKKLLKSFADQSDKLFDLGIIRTDSFTGEIGEYVASVMLELIKTDRVTQAVDGIDKNGKKYQVKAKVIENDKYNYGLGVLEVSRFDYLVVVYFNNFYRPLKIAIIHSNQLSSGSVSISSKFLNTIDCKIIAADEIELPRIEQDEILLFGKLYEELREKNIIRSRRIVGDLGEFYGSQYLDLILSKNKNEKGVDACDGNGVKYEIKTRRVYESGRRKSKTRRLNNLVGKDSEFLVVVVLDRSFSCAGMWLMPMKNVENPKSATLSIVNKTEGVKIIVECKIDWLV